MCVKRPHTFDFVVTVGVLDDDISYMYVGVLGLTLLAWRRWDGTVCQLAISEDCATNTVLCFGVVGLPHQI